MVVPVVDLDISVSDRVILEPHQVEMEHWGKMTKTTPFFASWRREEKKGRKRKEEEGRRRREAMTGGGRNVSKSHFSS